MSAHLLLLLLLLHLHLSLKPTAIAEAENQLLFTYNGFQGAKLNLEGAAKLHASGLLQLTNKNYDTGYAFYPLPTSFSAHNISFSTTFVVAMVSELQNLSGHGFTFVVSPSTDFRHATGNQYLGLVSSSSNGLSSNHFLAIELDTISNPEFSDINDNHVGIDVNSLSSVASAPAAYYDGGVNKSLKLMSGNPMQIWVEYEELRSLMNVTVAPWKLPKPLKPLLSTPINLSSVFLGSMYLGFSASNGVAPADYYVLGWSFDRTGEAQSLDLSKLPPLPHLKQSKQGPSLQAIISWVIASTVLVVIVLGIIYFIRRKKYEEILEDWEQEYGPQRFSYKDLYRATKGFKDTELLGVGGFGKVYKGALQSSKQEIAVKKISHDSKQGMKEFVAEIACMGRLRHRNLVQVLGYCRRRGELLLVYDYMPNGSLDKVLFKKKNPGLNWAQRYGIIKGVASALLYLHEEWEQVVLHRDIKASNVLLDADLNGRLGDFGLARLYDHGANPETTHVVGTVGYLAPEFTKIGKATTATDVFAFGVFMLEVACGRRPIEPRRVDEEVVLVDWVLEKWRNGLILETGDPELKGEYLEDEMELVLKLGLLCRQYDPDSRPGMRQVTQWLAGEASFPEMFLESAGVGKIGAGEEWRSGISQSFPSSDIKCSALSLSSNESILKIGR